MFFRFKNSFISKQVKEITWYTPYLDGHLYWKWNNIDLRIQRNMTQQHNMGKTQQHNLEKDSNWLDKLETRQLKKTHGSNLLGTSLCSFLLVSHLPISWDCGLAITPWSIKFWTSCFNLRQLFVLCPILWWMHNGHFYSNLVGLDSEKE